MTRRSWSFDIAVAVLVGALGQLEVWRGVGETNRHGPLWAQATLYALTAGLLMVRRLLPLWSLAAIVGVSVVEFAVFGSPEGVSVALPVAIAGYSVGRWLPTRAARWAPVLGFTHWAAWSGFDPMNDGVSTAERLATLVWLSPFLIAWLVGVLRRLAAANAEQRRTNRLQQEQQAVAEERNRIARELHDVLGHSVTVMTVQASAVRRRLTPEQAVERRALETVEAVGREALAEMRRIVSVLRQADDETLRRPAPGLGQVDQLAEQFRSAGLPVDVRVSGTPRVLAPGVDLTAYRIVQEGLTNALRHAAHAERAEVAIGYGDDRLELAVRDDGQPVAAAEPAESGSGLMGMRERVAVYGGSLVAEARPDGGFELVASLPLDPP